MTTISPNRRRRSFGTGSLFAAVAVVVCIVLVIIFRNSLSAVVWGILSPLSTLRDTAGGTNTQALEAALASSTAALADRTALYNQNAELKALLGRSVQNHTILGAVLLRPPGTPYDTLMIDIGKNDNVNEGALVFAGGSTVIGTISEVNPSSSRVTLFSAPGESYDALLFDGTPLALSGDGAGSLSGEVPAGTHVTVGEAVTLPGLLSAFVGSVSYISQQNGASFETLYLQLPVNLFLLKYVQVQLPS